MLSVIFTITSSKNANAGDGRIIAKKEIQWSNEQPEKQIIQKTEFEYDELGQVSDNNDGERKLNDVDPQESVDKIKNEKSVNKYSYKKEGVRKSYADGANSKDDEKSDESDGT
ncbi:MAG: hypothetical protein Q8Q33_09475, partial [Chlamydiota bacterium]|nr:hypothetical protein [Chlamydiota bacterium]